jgi:hypothetical protein
VKENEMEDVREVGAELHRLAEAEGFDSFDSAVLLQRGRKGKRRRKFVAGGGAVAGVAVIALAATLLPNLGATGNQPQVADKVTPKSQFEPVPGVPRGEAGADQRITKAEAVRRCALRYPEEKRPLQGGGQVDSGRSLMYDIKTGEKPGICTVPGGDKPSAELIAAVAKDPQPATAAGQLRNCSVQLWVDLTNWRMMASDRSTRLGTTSLVAVSPSGRKAVACQISPARSALDVFNATSSFFLTLDALGADDPTLTPPKGDLYAAGGGSGSFCPGTPCKKNYHFTGWGRVSSKATVVRLQLGPGPTHDVKVTDGWFAFTWLSPTPADNFTPILKAYDGSGNLIKTIDQR